MADRAPGKKSLRLNSPNPIAARRANYLSMSQEDIATTLGIPINGYLRWENGTNNDDHIAAIVQKALDLDDDTFKDYMSRRQPSYRKSAFTHTNVNVTPKVNRPVNTVPPARKFAIFVPIANDPDPLIVDVVGTFDTLDEARAMAYEQVKLHKLPVSVFQRVGIVVPPTEPEWKED